MMPITPNQGRGEEANGLSYSYEELPAVVELTTAQMKASGRLELMQKEMHRKQGKPKACHHCGVVGHLARDCRNKLPAKKAKPKPCCCRCGVVGHLVKDCKMTVVEVQTMNSSFELVLPFEHETVAGVKLAISKEKSHPSDCQTLLLDTGDVLLDTQMLADLFGDSEKKTLYLTLTAGPPLRFGTVCRGDYRMDAVNQGQWVNEPDEKLDSGTYRKPDRQDLCAIAKGDVVLGYNRKRDYWEMRIDEVCQHTQIEWGVVHAHVDAYSAFRRSYYGDGALTRTINTRGWDGQRDCPKANDGDRIGIFVDFDLPAVRFYKNGKLWEEEDMSRGLGEQFFSCGVCLGVMMSQAQVTIVEDPELPGGVEL